MKMSLDVIWSGFSSQKNGWAQQNNSQPPAHQTEGKKSHFIKSVTHQLPRGLIVKHFNFKVPLMRSFLSLKKNWQKLFILKAYVNEWRIRHPVCQEKGIAIRSKELFIYLYFNHLSKSVGSHRRTEMKKRTRDKCPFMPASHCQAEFSAQCWQCFLDKGGLRCRDILSKSGFISG